MKVLIGKFTHEANTFASKPCTFELFTGREWLQGEDLFRVFSGTPDYLGGMIRYASENGIDLIPSIAVDNAAPTLERDCVDRVMRPLLNYVRRHKDELDGMCLALHGAGVGVGIDDLESYVLREVRAIVGPKLPITVTLDLHGNISQEMADLSNGLFGIKKYPHTDMAEAGYLAMKTLERCVKTGRSPRTAVRSLPMLLAPSVGFTEREPFPSLNAHLRNYCEAHGLIDATLFHGFPYADVACCSSSLVVVADDGAQEAADDLARYVWDMRQKFVAEILSPEEALERAKAVKEEGYVVINELSDNPGGGTPGDGTHLLREMLRQNLPRTVFGHMYDPEAAAFCHEHRVGERVSFSLGGRTEKLHGEPLRLENAEICALSDGRYITVSPMSRGIPIDLGKTARVRVGNVDIIISSLRTQTLDDRPFLVTGADVEQYRYVGLKSTNHFRGFFQTRAAAIIPTDPPGLHSANFAIYDYKKIARPVFPIDNDAEFKLN